MFEIEPKVARKQLWHFFALLLPFVLGIYFGDYRNLTEGSAYIFTIILTLSCIGLWIPSQRNIAIISCCFALGFFSLFEKQKAYRVLRKMHFSKEVLGQIRFYSIEQTQKLQKGQGIFTFRDKERFKSISLQIYLKDSTALSLKKSYWLRCQPKRIVNETYQGAFDLERFMERKGCAHDCFVSRTNIMPCANQNQLRTPNGMLVLKEKWSKLFALNLGSASAAIARALVLGQRDGISQQLRYYFQATGSMHILAVSGMHIGLFILLLTNFMGIFARWISKKQAYMIVLGLIWYYAFITGLSASVLRSVFMFSLLIFAQFFGLQRSQLTLLFFSAFCMLLYDPSYLFDIGFQLSYVAILGIYLYYSQIESLLSWRSNILQHLWSGTALGLSATLTTLPLSIYHFHVYPNYAPLAGLFLMSLSSFVLILSLCFPLAVLLPFFKTAYAFILDQSIELMLAIMRFFSHLPGALSQGFQVPFIWVLVFWSLSFMIIYRPIRITRKNQFLIILTLILWLNYPKRTAANHFGVQLIGSDKVLVYQCSKQVFVWGEKEKSKMNYLIRNLKYQRNCRVNYFTIPKGRSKFHTKQLTIQFDHDKQLRIKILAQKQSKNIELI